MIKLEEIHRHLAILPLHGESGVWILSEQVGDKGSILAYKGSDDCIDSHVFMKLKEIHRKLAILPLHRESRVLGPQRAGGRPRGNFGILVAR